MHYEGTIYRPPSEAHSLLVQATIGCSWNRCTFCSMYKDKKFRVRATEDVVAELRRAAAKYSGVRRVFLCDGNALALPMEALAEILAEIRRGFPGLEGVRAYASARDVLNKTPEDLAQLAAAGLDMVFLGLESGSDAVLQRVNKGITRREMEAAAARLHTAGIRQSVTVIAGLGGEDLMEEHILGTAAALNEMQPEFLGMLVLYEGEDSGFFSRAAGQRLRQPSGRQVLAEMQLLLEHLRLENCYFTSAHVSNYLHVKGRLPDDRQRLLALLAEVGAR